METLLAGVEWRTACEGLVQYPRSATLDAYPRENKWLGKSLASRLPRILRVFPFSHFTDAPRWVSVHASSGDATRRLLLYDV